MHPVDSSIARSCDHGEYRPVYFSSPDSPPRQMNGPDKAPFGLPGSTGKELSGPVSDQHLAFVGPGNALPTPPICFHGLLNLLEAGARLTGALAGYATGIGSQLLEQLVSNPTADTRELVRIIRDLEARGLDIDSAVALRALPNGDMGVYAIRTADDPFPELLATINGQLARLRRSSPPRTLPTGWSGTPTTDPI